MAISTCTRCGGNSFEVHDAEPNGSAFKLVFVQCTACGGVVGVIDYYNIGHEIQKIKGALGVE